MTHEQDTQFMRRALELAEEAAKVDEVPVGAVLVHDNKIIAEGFNKPIMGNNPCAHAEIEVLRMGAKALDNYRLIDTTLYVTLEPCIMCAGAMVHARVRRLVYGAPDPKSGVIDTKLNILDQAFLNHRVMHEGGLMAKECGAVLSRFFKAKRG
jgi:tRNA(adenine34) deaminase